MSFTEKHRAEIKQYILEKISEGQKNIVKHTSDSFSVSRQTVYNYINSLLAENIIYKAEKSYALKTNLLFENTYDHSTLSEGGEDFIYRTDIYPVLQNLPENVEGIWAYAFTEMMNNAIDHSESQKIAVAISQDYLNTTIIIRDDGIGIFKKIKEYFSLPDLDSAIQELFKGKLTTDSVHHSGEGIFFTSRILDFFIAMSQNKIFSRSKYDVTRLIDESNIINLGDISANGTLIFMQLSNDSKKTALECFDQFSSEDGSFNKTQIYIKDIFPNNPVSRSQAKRLVHGLDKFEIIEFDFSNISTIGQGFAHELFIVFQNYHPSIRISAINANDNVQRMINHVLNS